MHGLLLSLCMLSKSLADPSTPEGPGLWVPCITMLLCSILALLTESLPETFDGYRLILTKPLSNVFQTTHTVNLGSQEGSSYQFGALYAGTKKVAENEVCAFVQCQYVTHFKSCDCCSQSDWLFIFSLRQWSNVNWHTTSSVLQ